MEQRQRAQPRAKAEREAGGKQLGHRHGYTPCSSASFAGAGDFEVPLNPNLSNLAAATAAAATWHRRHVPPPPPPPDLPPTPTLRIHSDSLQVTDVGVPAPLLTDESVAAERRRSRRRRAKADDYYQSFNPRLPFSKPPPHHHALRRVTFWSPGDAHRMHGITKTPCPNHGWAHADHVCVGSWRAQRTVRDLDDRECSIFRTCWWMYVETRHTQTRTR